MKAGVSEGVSLAVWLVVGQAVKKATGVSDGLASLERDGLALADGVRVRETDRVRDRVGVRVRDEVTEPLTELEPERLGDELAVSETEADGLSVPDGL